jgi:Zn-dependent protease with chaperone function
MSFFEQQDRSRKKSALLIGLFILAVAGIVVSIYGVLTGALFYLNAKEPGFQTSVFVWFNPPLFFWVSVITTAIIILGSFFKIIALLKGGSYVAESLGGRRVNPLIAAGDEKQFLNTVEEIAIASGVPVPQAYILENEEGINAFAAGHSPSDAVIAVTNGCLNRLNRDEMQGVIAHEYSHLLNGDMLLNIRLIGLLSGILIIANIGYHIFRSAPRSRKGGLGAALIGLVLITLGYWGFFIARIIQCAISRQREYLADASSVQFTRNPAGLANALKKIAGLVKGSRIDSPEAEETCHMFFCSAIASLFATHPPIGERIRLIETSFEDKPDGAITPSIAAVDTGILPEIDDQPVVHIAANKATVINAVGTVSAQRIAYGATILSGIPESLRENISQPLCAVAIACCLLLDKNQEKRERQFEELHEAASQELLSEILRQSPAATEVDQQYRLPLIDLAMPALRQLSPPQYQNFMHCIDVLVQSDKQLSLFEFSLKTILKRRLGVVFEKPLFVSTRIPESKVHTDLTILLSVLAYSGQPDETKAEQAFLSARAAVKDLPADHTLVPAEKISPNEIDAILQRFSIATPQVKKTVLNACAHCVLFDNNITIKEAELLRAFAYALDLPLPPFLMTAA